MDWNAHSFIWLDWVVMTVGFVLIIWYVWRTLVNDKKKMQGADSQDYLFGKGRAMVHHRCRNLRCQHRLGTPCGTRWHRSKRWSRHGTLGDARLDDSAAWLDFRAILSVVEQQAR